MALHRSLFVARLLWIVPLILLFLTVNQAMVAFDVRETVLHGRVVTAEVISFETTERADITMASVRLRVPMTGGPSIERELPLPITFVRSLEGSDSLERRDSLEVFVASGADQEVVIAEIGRAQWRLAAINCGISLIGFILVSWGVFAWNRYLLRKGDPAHANT